MAKFGADVTIRSVSNGAYNATTGTVTESTTDIGVKGVLEDVNLREVNDLIQASDKRLTVAALDLNGTVPDTSDRVIINNIAHQIIRIVTIEQDNEPITYEIILRA
jgi:hypothetical protein